jgi:elongation factor P
MATLDYNEIKERKYIIYEDEPYEVVEAHVARKQKRKPQNQTKLKSLISGKVIPVAFHAAETVEEADILQRDAKFLFKNKGEFWFCDPNDPKNRFQISEDTIGTPAKFLKENTLVKSMVFDYNDEQKIIGVKLPIKVVLEVKEAPPAIKGNTAAGGGKMVILETGAQLTVPLFVEAGERVVVNTDTNEYVERYNEKDAK